MPEVVNLTRHTVLVDGQWVLPATEERLLHPKVLVEDDAVTIMLDRSPEVSPGRRYIVDGDVALLLGGRGRTDLLYPVSPLPSQPGQGFAALFGGGRTYGGVLPLS